MPDPELPFVLKRGAKRTVRLAPGVGDASGARVVKRFHSPGRIDRVFDRRRAEQERALLAELARRGLSVPRPVELVQRDGAWELATEWIAGATTLDDLLRGSVSPGVPPERIADALGRLLAAMHAVGLDHEDLHPGNLLVQADGGAWLVDVRAARLRSAIGPKTVLRDLVALTAATRERADERLRARFLRSYVRAASPVALAALGATRDPAAFAARIEDLARLRRRAVIERSRRRWTRASSACEPIATTSRKLAGFVSCALDPEHKADVIARAETVDASQRAAAARTVEERPLASGELLLRVTGAPREVRGAWESAARLVEHGLPAARPALFVCKPEPTAFFVLPAGSHAFGDVGADGDARAERAHALGTLDGTLRDRGLALAIGDEDALYFDRAGRIVVAAPRRLVARPGVATRDLPRLGELLGPLAVGARRRFDAAYVAAQRGGARDRTALAHALAGQRRIEQGAPVGQSVEQRERRARSAGRARRAPSADGARSRTHRRGSEAEPRADG